MQLLPESDDHVSELILSSVTCLLLVHLTQCAMYSESCREVANKPCDIQGRSGLFCSVMHVAMLWNYQQLGRLQLLKTAGSDHVSMEHDLQASRQAGNLHASSVSSRGSNRGHV